MSQIISTLDLYYLDQCSRRWNEDPPLKEEDNPARKLMKRIILMRTIGRDYSWSFQGIASIWDQIFWKGKEVDRENIKQSVQGILAARKLYNKLPQGKEFSSYSTENLTTCLDSDTMITSSGDFLLEYKDRYETWIYLQSTPKKIRRSPLPALENFLVNQKIRKSHSKPFYIVIYYLHPQKRKITYFKMRNQISEDVSFKITTQLVDKIKNKVFYSSIGEYCKDCKVNC